MMDAAGTFFSRVGAYAFFVGDFVMAVRRHGVPWKLVLQEAYSIGVRSLPILLIIAGFVGTNLALQGYFAFKPLGGSRLVGMFVSLAGVRELAPIIAAAMVAAKAGTEMASQIGVMRIREQIDALEVMAVNPMAWIIAPRLVGIMLVLPALTVISTFMMVGAGLLVSVVQLGVPAEIFLELASQGISAPDFLYGQIKALIFGLIICTVSCYFGFTCERGPEGVGKATNQAVVTSAVICVVLNYFLSEVFYGGAH
jgi:phospholipid/cholesterol/gamma-HCH transport system permease protein